MPAKLHPALLKELQGTPHVCRYIASGCVNGYNYLIMELLADNLAQNFRTHRQSKLNTAICRSCWLLFGSSGSCNPWWNNCAHM